MVETSNSNVTFEELAAPAPEKPVESPAPAAAATTEPAKPVAETLPTFTEADQEAYRTIVEAGITPQNYSQFLQAKTALENLSTILKNNPRLFLQEIEKSDPALAQAILTDYSDAWYERYSREHPEEVSAQNGSPSRTAASVDPRIEQKLSTMEQTLARFIEKENREATERQQKAIADGFNSAMDTLSAKLPESMTERDKDYVKLKAQELLWKDTVARDRVAKGLYVDVPKYFAKAVSLATAETKTATDKEKERREGVVSRGTKEIVPAAESVGGEPVKDSHADPIWGDIKPSEVNAALAARR